MRGLRAGKNIRVKPYALTSGSRVTTEPMAGDFQGGVDVKYGVTTGLVWDFTVNTDFSQVEADEQQVNLTRFNLFFPEKRDFFLENQGIFAFGKDGGQGGGGGNFGRPHEPASGHAACSSRAASDSRTPARRFRFSAAPA